MRNKYVYAEKTSEYWGIVKNQKCLILKSFFQNGESWCKLKNENGDIFESPSIFWNNGN